MRAGAPEINDTSVCVHSISDEELATRIQEALHIDSLAEHGKTKPSHFGPKEIPELKGVVENFGPGGSLAMAHGFQISQGYDCRTMSKGGSDEDADG